VLLARCWALYQDSSSDPEGTSSAIPLIVVLILPREAVFIPRRSSASEPDRGVGRDGDGERPGWLRVGGRCEIQSWTKSETRALHSRLYVFRDVGGVVMIMVGAGE
jgi:hypothetical protein